MKNIHKNDVNAQIGWVKAQLKNRRTREYIHTELRDVRLPNVGESVIKNFLDRICVN